MTNGTAVDRRSFQLGMINCFAEMVAVGVKRLAISPPLAPEEYQEIREASEAIVEGSGIRSHLDLKERKASLEAAGASTPAARAEISREFMRLLSYPEDVISDKLAAGGKADSFILDVGT